MKFYTILIGFSPLAHFIAVDIIFMQSLNIINSIREVFVLKKYVTLSILCSFGFIAFSDMVIASGTGKNITVFIANMQRNDTPRSPIKPGKRDEAMVRKNIDTLKAAGVYVDQNLSSTLSHAEQRKSPEAKAQREAKKLARQLPKL